MSDRARIESALEQYLEGDAVTRRRFIGRGASAGLMLGGFGAVLQACGGVEGTTTDKPADTSVSHPKEPIGNWTFSNWPLYIDKKVLKDFDKRFGGRVKYVEDINDNFEFFGKVRQQLAQGTPIGRDLVVLTDYMCARWLRSSFAEAIDKANVPNAKNLVSNLQSINYDEDRSFTLPWQSGAIGLGYDIKQTGRELTSVEDLFDPEFKGRVTMLAEQYDSAGTVLLGMGVDPSEATVDQQLEAIEKIDQANRDGQFRRFTGNDYTTDLTKGNVAVALAYSGDLVQLASDNPNLRFAYPDEGAMVFNDNMMMPKNVEHPYAAETMMNFVYEPEVAAKICAYVNYLSPVDGVREILLESDPDLAENELIFPSDEIRGKLHPYPEFDAEQEQTVSEAMAKVIGA